jgi:inositol-pentakisphosphate 2-kinase
MYNDGNKPTEVRLGDLDLKTAAGGKEEYWLDIERRLIQEGWYTGEREGQEASECALQGAHRQAIVL